MGPLSQTDLKLVMSRVKELKFGEINIRIARNHLEALLECEIDPKGSPENIRDIKCSITTSLKIPDGESFNWFEYKDSETRFELYDLGLKNNIALYGKVISHELKLNNTHSANSALNIFSTADFVRIAFSRIGGALSFIHQASESDPKITSLLFSDDPRPGYKLATLLNDGLNILKETDLKEYKLAFNSSTGNLVARVVLNLSYNFLDDSSQSTAEAIISEINHQKGEMLSSVISAALDDYDKEIPGKEFLLEAFLENNQSSITKNPELLKKLIRTDPNLAIQRVYLEIESQSDKETFFKYYFETLFNEAQEKTKLFYQMQAALLCHEEGLTTESIFCRVISHFQHQDVLPQDVIPFCTEIVMISAQVSEAPDERTKEILRHLLSAAKNEDNLQKLEHTLTILENLVKNRFTQNESDFFTEYSCELNELLHNSITTGPLGVRKDLSPEDINCFDSITHDDLRKYSVNEIWIKHFRTMCMHSARWAGMMYDQIDRNLLDEVIELSIGSNIGNHLEKIKQYVGAAHTSTDSWYNLRFGEEIRGVIGLSIHNPQTLEKSLDAQQKKWSRAGLLNETMIREVSQVFEELLETSHYQQAAVVFKTYKEFFGFKGALKNSKIVWDHQENFMKVLSEEEKKHFCSLF